MKWLFFLVVKVALLGSIAVFLAHLAFPLPDITDRIESRTIAASLETTLGRRFANNSSGNPSLSGVVALRDGLDALASRLELADRAESSIDLQYYIWHDDTSGMLLFDALYRAAERGVRIRLLLDDNGVPGLDSMMAALNAHSNFQIRLYNPSTVRSPKMAGYTFDFFRMNRRMHNKSMIVDGAVAIIGGRNIGDEYFQVGNDVFYVDSDALVAGSIVTEAGRVFDDYWNSASVFELERMIAGSSDLAVFKDRLAEVTSDPIAKDLVANPITDAQTLEENFDALEWTTVQLVADDPVKGLGIATQDQLMITRLSGILGEVHTHLDMASAYFVPGEAGTRYFTDLASREKQVRILTNALDTTDVLLVHSGYTKYRRSLLEAGVELFELKLRGDMSPEANLQLQPLGLSGASLHAKTFAVDGKRVFIGSFNFDPRSARLNTEMGLLIDSSSMAQEIHKAFDGPLPIVSYRPRLTPEDKMIWQETLVDDQTVIYQEEPGATWAEQIMLSIIGLLPVEWML